MENSILKLPVLSYFLQVAKIKYEQNILEKESMQKMETINDSVHLAKEKSKTDAEFYKIQKQAEANKLLLSKEYLELKKVEAMATNNKVRILFMRVPLYNTP